MGHFEDHVKSVGKNVKDAENNAHDNFMERHGERYDIREITLVGKIRDVPPKKKIEKKKGKYVYIEFDEDPTAPKNEWLGEWEFIIHSHA